MDSSRGRIAGCVVAGLLVAALTGSVAMPQEPVPKDSSAPQESAMGEDRANWALQGADQAVAKARQIVGLSDRMDLPGSAEIVILAEDNTPFLSDQIIGRQVWHIVISNWRLELKSAPADVKDSYTRTFDIFVDPRNGDVLKIVSRWPEGVPPIAREPGARAFTEQMRRSGDEKYHGFPEEKPRINFLDALDSILKDGGNPLNAEQIVGQYVLWSRLGREPRSVWAITLRGIHPLWEAAYPGVGVDARNHLRHIVDAQTGKWLCAGTSPQPEG